MAHTVAAPIPFPIKSERTSAPAGSTLPQALLSSSLRSVQEALLRGVRLRRSVQVPATTKLELLADELDLVVEQIRSALGTK